jgi:hypothetical protein
VKEEPLPSVLSHLKTGAALVAIASLVACAAETSGGEPAPSTTEPVEATSHAESLGTGLTGIVGGVAGAVGLCKPLTCCFPSGGGWGSDTFEDGLRALGCSTPAAYSPSAGSSEWWLYTQCKASPQLSQLVAKYSNVAPYDAQFVVNECLALDALTALQLDAVFVEFDPTCNSCKPAR